MFLNAVMLAGIAAAVLPVVLHLLNRARYTRVTWGAMMFLEESEARHVDRSKLAQWLLLALRIAAIAVFALALARPVTQNALLPAEGATLTAVIVLDATPSMGHPEQKASRFDLARQTALNLLAQLRRGDQAGLVVLGRPAGLDMPVTTDLQAVATQLASLDVAAGSADLGDGLRRANDLLRGNAVAGGAEIYLIADRQESAWAPLTGGAKTGENSLAGVGVALPKNVQVVAVPVGSTENLNVSVESIELLNPPAVAGRTVDVQVRLKNWGPVARSDLPLTIARADKPGDKSTDRFTDKATEKSSDKPMEKAADKPTDRSADKGEDRAEKYLDQVAVHMAANSEQVFRRSVKLPREGQTVLTATIGPSGVPGDDHAALAVEVVPPIGVTVVTGESPAAAAANNRGNFSGETDYLRLALMPYRSTKERGEDAFAVNVVSQEQWPSLDDKKLRVVVLANINRLDEKNLRDLERFVYAGGGLLLTPGSRTTAQFWNNSFYRSGVGLAPAEVASIEGAGDSVMRWVGIKADHPVFSYFSGRSDPLPPVTVLRRLRFNNNPAATVLAGLQTGDPLMLSRDFGRGRVVALAIPISDDWSNFTWSNLYLPTMQSLMRYLGSARAVDRNLSVGSALEATFATPQDRSARVFRPDRTQQSVPMSVSGQSGTVVYTETDLPGIYTVRSKGERDIQFVINPGSGESDLSLQTDEELEALLKPTNIKLATTENVTTFTGRSRHATEFSVWLLAVVVALLGVELMVAQRSVIARSTSAGPAGTGTGPDHESETL